MNNMIQFNLKRSVTVESFEKLADDIGDYVQTCGGGFAICRHHIEFYIPVKNADFLAIRFPILQIEKYVW
jgi:hypothetical protein